MLCYPVQRYKIESNPQLTMKKKSYKTSCVTQYKDTNLKAIHNLEDGLVTEDFVVLPRQRYKFESNPQPLSTPSRLSTRCVTQYKDTNLKAIHNYDTTFTEHQPVVLHSTKIQI